MIIELLKPYNNCKISFGLELSIHLDRGKILYGMSLSRVHKIVVSFPSLPDAPPLGLITFHYRSGSKDCNKVTWLWPAHELEILQLW